MINIYPVPRADFAAVPEVVSVFDGQSSLIITAKGLQISSGISVMEKQRFGLIINKFTLILQLEIIMLF
jgi:hypothetical protein